MFEHMIVSAEWFLLRQRRNRCWGVADLVSEKTAEQFADEMKLTVHSMASDTLFEFTKVFDESLPEVELKNKIPQQKLQEAIQATVLQRGGDPETADVYIDCSTSEKRPAEKAIGISTCVRPTHAVYSNRLKRYLTVAELWLCQGLFPDSFANPHSVTAMLKDRKHRKNAQDLAGRIGETLYMETFNVCLCSKCLRFYY